MWWNPAPTSAQPPPAHHETHRGDVRPRPRRPAQLVENAHQQPADSTSRARLNRPTDDENAATTCKPITELVRATIDHRALTCANPPSTHKQPSESVSLRPHQRRAGANGERAATAGKYDPAQPILATIGHRAASCQTTEHANLPSSDQGTCQPSKLPRSHRQTLGTGGQERQFHVRPPTNRTHGHRPTNDRPCSHA